MYHTCWQTNYVERVLMSKTKETKGQMRLVEAILASFIIILAITFLNVFAFTPLSPKYETSDLERIGTNVLHDMDEKGLLCRFVYNEEWTTLKIALMVSLPPEIYFDLNVYDANFSRVNDASIRYGDLEVFENSSYVASVTYLVPGYQADYDPQVILLQLVRE
jgi:hypothetical protein